MPYPTEERLKELLHYDPETGYFTRIKRRGSKAPVGRLVGSLDRYGHLTVSIDRTHCRLHRLAFIYMSGALPEALVDHIDGNGSNNRWANLREATHELNCENRRNPRPSKKDGLPLGVRRVGRGWMASIASKRKYFYLGTFDSIAEAAGAYVAAKRELHAGCTI